LVPRFAHFYSNDDPLDAISVEHASVKAGFLADPGMAGFHDIFHNSFGFLVFHNFIDPLFNCKEMLRKISGEPFQHFSRYYRKTGVGLRKDPFQCAF